MEKTPQIDEQKLLKTLLTKPNDAIVSLVNKINETYVYWDNVKHKASR